MKKIMLFVPLVIITMQLASAQKYSCDLAYRFDASYTRPLDQLDNVVITLQTPPPSKNTEAGGKRNAALNNFYAVSGSSSSKQFTSIEANIGFNTCYVLQPNLELCKAEVRNGMRTFTVPAGTGGNLSVNIPIRIITPPGTINSNNGQVAWGRGSFQLKCLNGYLQPGEYILIDKNSLSPGGSQMKGYAFSIQ